MPDQNMKQNHAKPSQNGGGHSPRKKPVILGQKPTKARRAPAPKPTSSAPAPAQDKRGPEKGTPRLKLLR